MSKIYMIKIRLTYSPEQKERFWNTLPEYTSKEGMQGCQ